MQAEDDNQREMIRYLLGEMAEEERAKIEDRFFEDDEFFELVAATETEIVDRYARGTLSERERMALERTILSTPQGRDRLAFARALAERADAPAVEERVARPVERTSPWEALSAWLFGNRTFAFAVAAGLVLAVAGLSWLALERNRTPPTPPDVAHVEPPGPTNQPPQPDQPAPPSKVEPPVTTAPAPKSLVAFSFPTLVARGVEARVLRVPKSASTVRLKLGLEPDDETRYTAVLKTTDGQTVLRREGLAARGEGLKRRVTLDVDTKRLANAEYELTLTKAGNGDEVADVVFRIDRE